LRTWSRGPQRTSCCDLQGVDFIDACGLGLLLESRRQAVAAGGCVRLVAPSRPVCRLLTLTGSYGAFTRFDSLPQAVTAPVKTAPEEVS
jgi:anti-sigma B factor antagonist